MKAHRRKVWFKKHRHIVQQKKEIMEREAQDKMKRERSEIMEQCEKFDPEVYCADYMKKAKRYGYVLNPFTRISKFMSLDDYGNPIKELDINL